MKENTRLIIAIFCIAFIVRFLFFLIMPQFFDRMFRFWDDWIYLTYAKNIISQGLWIPDISKLDVNIYGKQYNAHIIGPGYPLVISLMMLLFGDQIKVIMFLNVIFSSLTCIVIYHLGKEVFNKQIGILSSIWSIIYVYFMVYIPRVMKENMLQLFVPLVILLMVYEIKREKVDLKSILFPLSFTFLIHTDERYILFIPIIFISIITCNYSCRLGGLKKFIIFITIVVVLSIPWAIRNYVVYDRFVFLTTRTERVTKPLIDIIKLYDISISHKTIKNLSKKNLDYEGQKKLNKKYFDNNKDNNLLLFNSLDKMLQRLSIYWAPMVLRESKFKGSVMIAGSLKYNLGGMLTFGILLPFFLVGTVVTIKNNKLGLSLILFILIQSSFHVAIDIINPWPRYRYPIDSLIIIIAFYGFYQLLQLEIFKRLVLRSSKIHSFLYGSKR